MTQQMWTDEAVAQWLQAALGKEKIRNANDAVKYGKSAVGVIVGELNAALAARDERIGALEAQLTEAQRYVPVEYNDIINVDNGNQIRVVIDQSGRNNGIHLHIRKRVDGEWRHIGLTRLADNIRLCRLADAAQTTHQNEGQR